MECLVCAGQGGDLNILGLLMDLVEPSKENKALGKTMYGAAMGKQWKLVEQILKEGIDDFEDHPRTLALVAEGNQIRPLAKLLMPSEYIDGEDLNDALIAAVVGKAGGTADYLIACGADAANRILIFALGVDDCSTVEFLFNRTRFTVVEIFREAIDFRALKTVTWLVGKIKGHRERMKAGLRAAIKEATWYKGDVEAWQEVLTLLD